MQQPTNPLLRTLRLPGETVVLPSKALFYKNGEVAKEVIDSGGEIYVQPMTTYEEILMKTPDMLFTGQSVVQTFARCIPQIYNPLELLAADIDFLLITLRKVTFGNQIVVSYDHNCTDSKSHEYAINTSDFIKRTVYADPATIAGMFQHTLPNGQTVNMQPFRFKDILDISQVAVNEPTGEDITDLERAQYITNLLATGTNPAIRSVVAEGEEITDREMINEWVHSLPVMWVKELSDVIEESNKWGAKTTTTTHCQDCGQEINIQIPLNPQSFFMLPSDLGTQT